MVITATALNGIKAQELWSAARTFTEDLDARVDVYIKGTWVASENGDLVFLNRSSARVTQIWKGSFGKFVDAIIDGEEIGLEEHEGSNDQRFYIKITHN